MPQLSIYIFYQTICECTIIKRNCEAYLWISGMSPINDAHSTFLYWLNICSGKGTKHICSTACPQSKFLYGSRKYLCLPESCDDARNCSSKSGTASSILRCLAIASEDFSITCHWCHSVKYLMLCATVLSLSAELEEIMYLKVSIFTFLRCCRCHDCLLNSALGAGRILEERLQAGLLPLRATTGSLIR